MSDTKEAKAPKAAKEPKEAKPKAPPVPRGPSPENQARLDKVIELAAAKPGITNPEVSKELGMSTLACSQLIDRLVKKGKLQLVKGERSVRMYYPAGHAL